MYYISGDVKINQISSSLYEVKKFFTSEATRYFLNLYQAGHDWQFDTSSPYRLSKVVVRDQHTNDFIQSVEQFLSTNFDAQYTNQDSKLFLDMTGYRCGCHFDSPQIDVMLQIYLESDHINTPGTIFHLEKLYQSTFEPNCGYINFNHDTKWHESGTVSGVRKSFVGSFSRIKKDTPI